MVCKVWFNLYYYFAEIRSAMEFEQTLEIVNRILNHKIARSLTEVETSLLFGAWHNLSYDRIADRSGYSVNYLQRDLGPKFWKLLSDVLGRQVNKTNLRSILTYLNPIIEVQSQIQTVTDWGEAIDTSTFHGRISEIETLTEWIVRDRCRLIAIVGMGGMGKSTLAAKVARLLAGEFEYVIWRSLRNAPPLEILLAELVAFVSEQQDIQATPERLLYWLQQHRCFVILDNQETILKPGDRAGYYQSDFTNYGDLLQLLGEAYHQSCVLLTSREKSAEVGIFEDDSGMVRSFTLRGSWEASLALIDSHQLVGSQVEKNRLCELYSCKPLALKMVVASIQSLFDRQIAAFLKTETLVFSNIRRLLDHQFQRLSSLEQTIMYWLAIERDWTTIAELHAEIVPAVNLASLLESLESLTWRSLIEQRSGKYSQQPVVMEYVTDCLIDRLAAELLAVKLVDFDRYAIIKTTVLDYIRDSQIRFILTPLVDRLREKLPNAELLEQHLQSILASLRCANAPDLAYGVGNFINLCLNLQIDLSQYNFSNLKIRHAYLQDAVLRNVNFRSAQFDRSVFAQIFGSVWVQYSPDGQHLAIGNNNGELQIWQVETMQIVMTISAHQGWIWAIAWSPDSTLLASGCVDLTVGIWDVRTGQCIQVCEGFTSWIYSIAWSPDATRIAASGQEPTIRVWERLTGVCTTLVAAPDSWVPTVVWVADGSLLAAYRDGTIKLWDIATGTLRQTIPAHQDIVLNLALHPDGRILASSSLDRAVKLWDWHTGECLQTTIPTVTTNDCVWCLEWSPDGNLLAGSSQDCSVKLWDLSLQCVKVLQGHKNWVWVVSWSPNGETLASASHDRTVKFWQPSTGECLKTLRGYCDSTWCLRWSQDGIRLLSSSTNHNITLWNSQTGECLKVFSGHRRAVWTIAWSPDESLVASASEDATVRIWDARTGDCVRVLRGHDDMVWSVVWSPDGQQLISGGDDRTVRLWDANSGQCLLTLLGHLEDVSSFVWFPHSRLVASGSIDATIRFWDLNTGACAGAIVVYSPVYTIALSPDGQILASGDYSGRIMLWQPGSGECIKTLWGHTGHVYSIAWSPDGQSLASASADLTARIWDVATGACVEIIPGENWGGSIVWHPDGTFLAIGYLEQPIQIWDVHNRRISTILKSERPYEGMKIAGIKGIVATQQATLRALGAVD
jgi:WD40 repeat protein